MGEELYDNAPGLLRGLLLRRWQRGQHRLMHQFSATDDPALREYLDYVVPLGRGGLRTDHDVDGTAGVQGDPVACSAQKLLLLLHLLCCQVHRLMLQRYAAQFDVQVAAWAWLDQPRVVFAVHLSTT